MLSLKKIAIAALLPATAITVTAATIALSAPCAQAGKCGECYDTGKKGVSVKRGKYWDCDVCFVVPSSEGLLAFDPGSVGGPGRTGGSGTRQSDRLLTTLGA